MKIQDLAPIVSIAIIFVVAGVTLGVGAEILNTLSTTVSTDSTTNESQNFAANNTYYDITNTPVASVSSLHNIYDNCTFDTSRYNYTTTQIRIYVNGTGECPNMTTGTHYFDYTHRATTPYRAIENTSEGVGKLADWLPIIGLVVAAAIVIGIVFWSFSKGRV